MRKIHKKKLLGTPNGEVKFLI